jgi:hypothetical protein
MSTTISRDDVLAAIDVVGQNYSPTLTTVMKGLVEQSSNFRNINRGDKLGAFALNPNALKNYDVDPFNPMEAATAAFDLLDKGIRATGSLETGIAAYNTGLGKVNRFVNGKGSLDPTTSKFVPQVLARSNKYDPGIFDMGRIDAAAEKVGYTGRADFEALAGGKKNILPKGTMMLEPEPVMPQLQAPEPMAPTAMPPAMPSVEQSAQAIQPEMPTMAPDKEADVASIFGMQPEAQPTFGSGLPEGLMADIRKAVAEV